MYGLHLSVICGTVMPLYGNMGKSTVSAEVTRNSEVDNGLLQPGLHHSKSERKSQATKSISCREIALRHTEQNSSESEEERMKSDMRNEIKAYIVRQGMTMQEVVDVLSDEYGWSDSVSNLSNKLQRESLRYKEAVQLADALGYDIQWVRRKAD